MKIFVYGSMAYDRIMDFPGRFADHILPNKIHILNVCFTVNSLVEKFGGTAGNIAYTLRLLEEKPIIIATIGKDYHSYFEWLKKNDIPTEGIKIIEEEYTASAYITTDKSDNQITGFNPGAMKYPSNYDFNEAIPEKSICIIAPGNIQDMKRYAEILRTKGVAYICDPGQSITQWNGDELRDWINGSFILISNDYEMELIMKVTGLDKKGLLTLTKTIITTLGEKGSIVSNHDHDIFIPAAKVSDIIDPTGAGDAYRAGLLKGIVMGKDIETSAKIGAICAAYAVERYGTQEHSFSYEEFLTRYRDNFGDDL